jgi:hypothetical protein
MAGMAVSATVVAGTNEGEPYTRYRGRSVPERGEHVVERVLMNAGEDVLGLSKTHPHSPCANGMFPSRG